ncbi:MAG TPA: hydroxymethylbilane synthase [Candidatus Saccharimonadales bacterium]|jgi:hydroxymethylbilane synthase|nr:hydroxymethylbilane synthase [Candidatus Saccharimonadales bacterium]
MAHLRIGSRGSQLALWQANHVADLLRAQGHTVALQIIKTTGDKITDVALSMVGTKGMFTKEIEEALAAGAVDLAVHSLKDLPTELQSEFHLAAVMKREDPRDAFVSSNFFDISELPEGARVGTSSLRRQSQLLAYRRDLRVLPLRGNIDSRMKKVQAGEYDAIILAAAGVSRLALSADVTCRIPPELMCPAAGQGALGIEIRSGDPVTLGLLKFLDNEEARATTTCERALLQALGGGCQVPIGALAEVHNGKLVLDAMVGRPDGSQILRSRGEGRDPETLGKETAAALIAKGADAILRDIYGKDIATLRQT